MMSQPPCVHYSESPLVLQPEELKQKASSRHSNLGCSVRGQVPASPSCRLSHGDLLWDRGSEPCKSANLSSGLILLKSWDWRDD